jgi:hypothetical protein
MKLGINITPLQATFQFLTLKNTIMVVVQTYEVGTILGKRP